MLASYKKRLNAKHSNTAAVAAQGNIGDFTSMRWLLALLCLTFASLTQANAAPSLEGKVDKGPGAQVRAKTAAPQQRQRPEKLPCLAGQAPDRPEAGRRRQPHPEGFYWIDWRKTSNNYNLSMHISYPNARDVAKVREKGLPPVA